MKIILLHGDNSLKSYERLQTFVDVAKKRGWEVKKIYDNSQKLSEILNAVSLFNKVFLFILDDISLLNKNESVWLKNNINKIDGTLVIYHKDLIPQTYLKLLPVSIKKEEYRLPKLVWSFLESFYPKNGKNVYFIYHELIKNEPIELVFYLLANHVRDLFWVREEIKSVPYPTWRVGKLAKQANKFDKKALDEIIELLAKADIKSKTSQDNLSDALDFIIATKLE
ncbi:hypothetical protein A2955_00350 [Candidatus Woesebacteria bacterium RIFCSPLOWO2_01_FULL_37_19]|uniref:DNA polymerase III delta N-terminal domain-containing protein n=1 Tax=Candidatus Woesebacteria bacterium RIFCSPLOWO2_01_FULL_37_19 TaxID=1802514 RepID=A0A1F8BDE2_9BACT|nr:MAG: hypothetical protein A2955_00350 [Candidatus Woesebacteria bacterium RIFCSPLOWO2_01_FULL_37_19]